MDTVRKRVDQKQIKGNVFLKFVVEYGGLKVQLLHSGFYVPVTVHREWSVKKEYQQDATI